MASKVKEVKLLLKLAKESIQGKNYVAALEHCRQVLDLDQGNYHALVFLGVAHENREADAECLDAYMKAVEISPDQILAWQGLVKYYEKKCFGVNQQKLITAYEKIISLLKSNADNDEKVYNLEQKLANMLVRTGQKSEAFNCYQALLQRTPMEGVCEKVTFIHNEILRIVDVDINEVSVFHSSVKYFLFNKLTCDSLSTDELCSAYLAMFDCKSVDELEAACRELQSMGVSSVVPLEISMTISLDKLIVLGEDMPENIFSMAEEIEKTAPNSLVLQAWKAHSLNTKRKFSEARKLATALFGGKVAAFRVILIQADAGLHDTNSVIRKTELLLNQLKDSKIYSDEKAIARILLILQVDALLQEHNEENVSKAGQLCKRLKLEHDCVEVDVMLCHLCLVLGNDTAAGKICDRLIGNSPAELAAIGWFQYHTDQLDSARQNLENAVEKSPDEPHYMYQLARVYWKLMSEGSLPNNVVMTTLLKAAKLDPFHSETFFWLGRYFEKFSQDFEKSKRCYRKAYDLKPSNETSAEYLVTSLDRLGLKDDVLQVLRSVTERASAGGAKWAWLRLGLYQVKDDASAAIQCFQSAIRADPTDAYCWQCLAEGYLNRGSFNAAMKTFTKANDLDPRCMYNLFQLAGMKQLIGLHLDAVEDYKRILRESDEYVPALKGVAETHIYMAKEAMTKFYSRKALDNCTLAIGYLTRAAVKRPDLAMIWKLIGDALLILGDVSDTIVRMSVPGKLCGEAEDKELGLLQLLKLGARSYRTALQISENDSVIWHDLGVNYYYQAKVTGASESRTDAVNCLKKSLMLNSNDAQVWSTLGVVLSKSDNKANAQHCFIRAVELDAQNAQAWTNLGVLYLGSEKIGLAHQAFQMAQSTTPEYVNGWIGQAMVAETVSHAETADLYRHSSELALHEEAALGYAHWIAKSLDEGREVSESATLNASVGLARYLDKNPDDAIALNMFGLLLERQGQLRTAVEVLRRAVDNSKKDEVLLQSTRTNFARVLGKTGNHDLAMTEFGQLKNSFLSRGFALHNAKKFDGASVQYQEAMNGARETDRGQISSVLGRCAYWLRDLSNAETILLTCASSARPHVQELMSLGAFSLLNDNLVIAGDVVQKLEKRIDGETVVDICRMIVMFYTANDQRNEAISFLEEQIEAYPQKVELSLLKTLLSDDNESKHIDELLQSIDPRPDNLRKLSEICTEAGKSEAAYRYAHNSVLCHPNDPSRWLLLAHTVILQLLRCNDFERCGRYIDGIARILDRIDDADVEKMRLYTALIGEFREKLAANHGQESNVGFLVERMENNRMAVSFHDSSSEDADQTVAVKPQPAIDGKAVLLHGFMEIVTIGLRLRPDTRSLNELLEGYETSGFRQFDEDVFTRDEAVYNRKCAVKKDGNVKFPYCGLNCRTRYLAHNVATR